MRGFGDNAPHDQRAWSEAISAVLDLDSSFFGDSPVILSLVLTLGQVPPMVAWLNWARRIRCRVFRSRGASGYDSIGSGERSVH
jgi:hypothetical protein